MAEGPDLQDWCQLLADVHQMAMAVQRLTEFGMGAVDEIRCRRLVVVDENGVERIVASVHRDSAQLSVLTQTGFGLSGPTGIDLVVDGDLGDQHAGIHLVGYGDSRGSLLLSETDGQFTLHSVFDG